MLASTTTLGLTITTTIGVIDRIHDNTTNAGALTKPTVTTGFTKFLAAVIAVADLTNRRAALGIHQTQFAGRHLKLCHSIFDGYELH